MVVALCMYTYPGQPRRKPLATPRGERLLQLTLHNGCDAVSLLCSALLILSVWRIPATVRDKLES